LSERPAVCIEDNAAPAAGGIGVVGGRDGEGVAGLGTGEARRRVKNDGEAGALSAL